MTTLKISKSREDGDDGCCWWMEMVVLLSIGQEKGVLQKMIKSRTTVATEVVWALLIDGLDRKWWKFNLGSSSFNKMSLAEASVDWEWTAVKVKVVSTLVRLTMEMEVLMLLIKGEADASYVGRDRWWCREWEVGSRTMMARLSTIWKKERNNDKGKRRDRARKRRSRRGRDDMWKESPTASYKKPTKMWTRKEKKKKMSIKPLCEKFSPPQNFLFT